METSSVSDFLKEVRVPITALFALIIFAGVALLQRQHFLRVAGYVETFTVAKILGELPAEALAYEGSNYPNSSMETQDDQFRESDLENAFQTSFATFRHFGAMEVIGQSTNNCSVGCNYTTLMPGGGWLHFTVGPSNDKYFQDLRSGDKKELSYHQETYGVQTAGKGRHKQPPMEAAPGGRELYYIAVSIDKDRSPVISNLPQLVFTNVHQTENPLDFTDVYPVAGPVQVYFSDGPSTWRGPFSMADVSAEALGRSRHLGNVSKDVETAYLELRAAFEREEIELPLLNLKVSANSFLGYAFLISIGLSAWASFLLRALQRFVPSDSDDPWILVEPFRTVRLTSGLDKPLALLELSLFCCFHLTAMATPAVLAALMFATTASGSRLLLIVAIVLGAILSASMISKYLGIARSAWAYRGAAKQGMASATSGA